jgi:NAD(P)-dependent dehydrogenase (short-subunit alcohol dehydrogenase family)
MANAPRSLAGRVVAITGGARGIGRATAAALIARGARVAIGDIDGPLAERTAAELGGGALGLPLDVTNRASFVAFLDQVEDRLGPLDVLINNAGIMPVGPFLEESDPTAKRMIDINVHGVIFGSKLALERFAARRRGHLVNIASVAGKAGSPHLATYCASKFAVVGLSEALRQEFGPSGIDISVVMPVGVNTELYSGFKPMRGFKTPEPEEVAEAIVEALQTGRYEVYVPKRMNAVFRITGLLPWRAVDAIGNALGSRELMTQPDHAARAAYDARMEQTIALTHPSDAPPEAPERSDAHPEAPQRSDAPPEAPHPSDAAPEAPDAAPEPPREQEALKLDA